MGRGRRNKKRTTEDADLRTPSPAPSRVSPTPGGENNLREHFDQRFNEMRALLEAALAAKDAIIEKLTEQLTLCQARVERLDQQSRACNMILYNMPEAEDPAEAVKSLLTAETSRTIVDVARLGRLVPGSRRPRPVLVKFSTVQAKHLAFKKKKEAATTRKIFMDDDLTEQQRENRKRQLPTFVRLKEAGKRPFWRGDKLMQVTQEGVRQVRQGDDPSPA